MCYTPDREGRVPDACEPPVERSRGKFTLPRCALSCGLPSGPQDGILSLPTLITVNTGLLFVAFVAYPSPFVLFTDGVSVASTHPHRGCFDELALELSVRLHPQLPSLFSTSNQSRCWISTGQRQALSSSVVKP